MQGIIWEPDYHPADIDLEPNSTDIIVLLRERFGDRAIGMVVTAGSSVLSLMPGDLVRFPMLDATDVAVLPSRLRQGAVGWAAVRAHPARGVQRRPGDWGSTLPLGKPIERTRARF